jgi:uncharacterized protein YeaO (DUF488 family)
MPASQTRHPRIVLRRTYDDPAGTAGYRVLVDRIWPRGIKKEGLKFDNWARELAPSTELRKWFGHDPERWASFQERYRVELAAADKQALLHDLLAAAGNSVITLLYSAKDEEHNQAVVLRDVLSAAKET